MPDIKDRPKCDFCQSVMKPRRNKWVCDCGRGYKHRWLESAHIEYTPGPWSVDEKSPHMVLGPPPEGWYPTPQHPRYIVTQTSLYVNTPWQQHSPNARLIAAAPELLDALDAALDAIRVARAAILDRAGGGIGEAIEVLDQVQPEVEKAITKAIGG